MADFTHGTWLNTPPEWSIDDGMLSLTTGESTDFWRKTHYGFIRESGHFLQMPAPHAFTASLVFHGQYETLYDQAGIMLRIDAENWIKCGIEHSDGMTNFSIVVTRGKSDWSVIGQPLIAGPQTVRLTAQNDAVIAHFKTPDDTWQLMRVADFPTSPAAMIGPTACSPERSGFKASFLGLDVSSPIANPLHG
jgi:hypothetical protein